MKVLALDGIAQDGIDYLTKYSFIVDIKQTLTEDELIEIIPHYDILIIRSNTWITKDILKHAKNLKIIGRAGIGIDNIDITEAKKRNIYVTNAPSGNTVSVAEHTIGLLISLARHIPQANSQLKRGLWQRNELVGVELAGKTLGIIGLGKAGKAVAQRATAFQMNIIGYDPYVVQTNIKLLDIHDVFSKSDFITLHLPLVKETEHMIDMELLSLMKPSAMIINTSRGAIINEQALYKMLKEKKIAGASLDVFEKEPPMNNPLLSLENVIVTPHLGASTIEAQKKSSLEIAKSIVGILKK